MIISWIWAGLAGGLLASTLYYRKKWKDLQGEYDNRCEELTKAQESQITCQPFERLNRKLLKDNSEYMLLCSHGFLNLKADVDFQINSDDGYGVVAVVGTMTEIDKEFIVKVFTYELNDPSDREFAIREAEELIETIQKA